MESNFSDRIIFAAMISLIVAMGILGTTATAQEIPSAAQLMKGCREKAPKSLFPSSLLAKNIEGRALLRIERSPAGMIRVVRVEASEPQGAFDEAGTAFVANLTCKKLKNPLSGTIGISFHLLPGPTLAKFEGADETFEIARARIRQP